MKPGAIESPSEAARHGGGAFMRLEVVSMLKIAVLCVGAAVLQFLFTLVGYAGAPAVAYIDFTSQVSRCTSAVEFAPPSFLSCAETTNVTSVSMDTLQSLNDSTGHPAVVDTLLHLREGEQAAMLGCLLDQCRPNMTTRPFGVDDPETELLLAHYAFGIDGLTQRNRYFYLDVAFPNVNRTADTTFAVTLTPHVRGFVGTSANASFSDVLPDHRSLNLTISCHQDALFCEPAHFLRVTTIDYVRYRVDVLFNASGAMPINGRDPQFRKTWGASEFTNWMLGVKGFFILISIFMAVSYARNLALLRASEQTMEQNWVLALGIALVLYDDPFYWIEASIGGSALAILTVLFQATFFQMLLLFWLIALDNMRLQGKEAGVSNHAFFGPKISFVALFWFIQMIYHGYIKYYTTNDPFWDPLATNANFFLLRALMALLSLTYLGWFLTLGIMTRHEIRAKRARYKYLLAMSLWMVLTCFLGLGAGSFSPTPTNGGAWTSYMSLFNLYVWMLEFLYAPSATTLRLAKARSNTATTDVDPEATPALASPGPETPNGEPDEDEDAKVDSVELELA